MPTLVEVPLSPQAQVFSIPLAGVTYRLTLQWRIGCGWVMDVADQSGNAIVNGIPLVTGVDLLAPYPDKGFGGMLLVQTDGNVDAAPTYANLGVRSHLYFVTLP